MTGRPQDETMSCSVCGGPIFKQGLIDKYPHWLAEAILLHSEAEDSDVTTLLATNNGGPYFTVTTTGDEITVCEPPRLGNLKPQPFLATHVKCNIIAEEVVGFAKQNGYYVKHAWQASMHHLWLVLLERYREATKNYPSIPITHLWEPNGYYGGILWEDAVYWDASDDPHDISLAKVHKRGKETHINQFGDLLLRYSTVI